MATDWAERPVNHVNFLAAARFCNWLTSRDTEAGVYYLSPEGDSWLVTSLDRHDVAALYGVAYFLPTEDEWYKAAYYDPTKSPAGTEPPYWDYPTKSDEVPSNDLTDPDPGNNATFPCDSYPYDNTLGPDYWRTEVGAHENSEGPWGTFDQGGNVDEWTETEYTFDDTQLRVCRGGDYGFGANGYELFAGAQRHGHMLSRYGMGELGFRVAAITNLPPALTLCAAVTLLEGGLFTCNGLLTNESLEACTVAVDYGDGSALETVSPAADGSFTLSHVYCDDRGQPYVVTVTATDASGMVASAQTTVTVQNVMPTVTLVDPGGPFVTGEMITFEGSFTDPGCDSHTVSWTFGDLASVSDDLKVAHAYAAPGIYTVWLVVDDGDGGIGAAWVAVEVLSPLTWIRNLILYVEDLGLPPGPERSLVTKLKGTDLALERGNLNAAIGKALAFSLQVRTPAITRRLTATQAETLQRDAARLLASLRAMLNGSK